MTRNSSSYGPKELPIVADPTNNTISVGAAVIRAPYLRKEPEKSTWLKQRILEINGIESNRYNATGTEVDDKTWMQYLYQYFGKDFYKRLRAISFRLWFGDSLKSRSRYCRTAAFIPGLVVRQKLLDDLIQQAESDGNKHLIPFILLFGKDCQSLKQSLGKGLWKRLSQQSFNKNKLAVLTLDHLSSHHFFERLDTPFTAVPINYPEFTHSLISDIERVIQWPSTFLAYQHDLNVEYQLGDYLEPAEHDPAFDLNSQVMDCYHWIAKQLKIIKRLSDRKKANDLAILFADTVIMSINLQRPFNPQWSLIRMQEEHDQCIRIQNQRYLSRVSKIDSHRVSYREDFPSAGRLPSGDYRVLSTWADLVNEGIFMDHCVGGYWEKVCQRISFIYALETADGRSTVEYSVNKKQIYILQHKSHHNSEPAAENHRLAAELLKELRPFHGYMINQPIQEWDVITNG